MRVPLWNMASSDMYDILSLTHLGTNQLQCNESTGFLRYVQLRVFRYVLRYVRLRVLRYVQLRVLHAQIVVFVLGSYVAGLGRADLVAVQPSA